jgi:hypothetical protein
MKNYSKMRTLLKVSTVIILGYFIFEVLFGIVTGNFGMYGSETGSSTHHASSSGTSSIYSYDVIVNALLLLLVKLLIVIFFLVLISGAAGLMKELWNKEENNSKSCLVSKDTDTLLIVAGSFIGIMILYSVFKGFFIGTSEHTAMGWNNSIYFYNTQIMNIDNFLGLFLNLLLYITAVILGIQIFRYFMRKQKR